MKVMLFGQSGGDRPKARPIPATDIAAILDGEYGERIKAERLDYDRWWIVACEDVKAGRMVIQCEHPTKECAYRCCDRGRIMASGGAEMGR